MVAAHKISSRSVSSAYWVYLSPNHQFQVMWAMVTNLYTQCLSVPLSLEGILTDHFIFPSVVQTYYWGISGSKLWAQSLRTLSIYSSTGMIKPFALKDFLKIPYKSIFESIATFCRPQILFLNFITCT